MHFQSCQSPASQQPKRTSHFRAVPLHRSRVTALDSEVSLNLDVEAADDNPMILAEVPASSIRKDDAPTSAHLKCGQGPLFNPKP